MRDTTDEITLVVESDRVLTPEGLMPGRLAVAGDRIAGFVDETPASARRIEAGGKLVLPGIVDIHGDAFERQVMPRPRTIFRSDIAFLDTDRQLLANGITTAFHGITVSWEPGLRSLDHARALVDALTSIRPVLGCDTRLHIRWETFALEAVEVVEAWLSLEPRPILAFNDHTTGTVEKAPVARKTAQHAERAGVSVAEYDAMVEAQWSRRDQVPAAVERLAAAARAAGVVLLAHDERTAAERLHFRALGAVTSEFPMNRETAETARAAGEHTVMGAPNVLRGGSHNGMINATPAVADGLCTVLASDYYYPAPLHAAFRLVRDGVLALPEAWALVSKNAAEAAGLADRGVLSAGKRADLVVVDDAQETLPRVDATIVAGRTVFSGI
ncbi:MAG: alpha-D-ribose 1-methylphosphonate 5-triphosphate diphosphatase [Pseudomonadota bacterium]